MSTVMRPRGPLPPRVYWTRRMLLVAVVVVVGALLWWVIPGVGGSGSAAANPGGGSPPPTGQQPPTTPTTTSPTTDGAGQGSGSHRPGGTTHTPASSHHPRSTPPRSTPPPQGHHKLRRVLPEPSGPCDPKHLTLTVVVESAPVGKGTTVGLRMATGDGSTCSLGVTPSLLETRITSGDVVVWQSKSCPDALPARNVVVRPKPTVVYSYPWDGQINPDSCSATDRIAQPGGYWAEAALIGGEPSRSYFEVTAATKS